MSEQCRNAAQLLEDAADAMQTCVDDMQALSEAFCGTFMAQTLATLDEAATRAYACAGAALSARKKALQDADEEAKLNAEHFKALWTMGAMGWDIAPTAVVLVDSTPNVPLSVCVRARCAASSRVHA